jgi:beta-lactamase regulating signal transducer with metallopeptidase domain
MIVTRQPARRLRLARAAVLGLLALLPVEAAGLVPRLDLVAASRKAGLASHPAWSAGRAPVASPIRPEAAVVGPPREPHLVAVPVSVSAPARSWVVRAIAVTYAVGVAWGIAWLSLGYLGLAWLARRSRQPSPAVLEFYQALPHVDGARKPRLLISGGVRRPVLAGFPTTSILIPPELDPPEPTPGSRAGLRLALLHELAHAEAGDPWFTLAGHLAQAFWFVLPPLWWVVAQMRLDQEFLADRRAAVGFGPLEHYASSLLEFASARASSPSLATGSTGLADGLGLGLDQSPLFQRVMMLVRCPFPVEPRPPVWWSWGLPALAVIVTLGASSLSVRPFSPAATAPVANRLGNRNPQSEQVFRVAKLDVPPKIAGALGRAPLFELPIRLPERFVLNVEIWADPRTLDRMRVAGLPLHRAQPASETSSALETWHKVRVVRDGEVSLFVDDQPVPLQDDHSSLTTWLSVEPAPDCEGRFRGLTLTW